MFVQCIVYCVQCTPFPPVAEICARLARISVSTWQQSRVGQIVWFGWLSAILQLASRVGEGGGVRQLCLHSVTQPYTTWPRVARAGKGVEFPPLGQDWFYHHHWMYARKQRLQLCVLCGWDLHLYSPSLFVGQVRWLIGGKGLTLSFPFAAEYDLMNFTVLYIKNY